MNVLARKLRPLEQLNTLKTARFIKNNQAMPKTDAVKIP
jgi:hypothetical protein